MKYTNNPFNIKYYKSNRWFGSTHSPHSKFETFSKLEYGVRAFFIIIRSYYYIGHVTIANIVSRFAPSKENNTYNYIEFVCQRFEKEVPLFYIASERFDYILTTKQEFFVLAKAMAFYESRTILDDTLLERVWSYYHIENSKFPCTPETCCFPPLDNLRNHVS